MLSFTDHAIRRDAPAVHPIELVLRRRRRAFQRFASFANCAWQHSFARVLVGSLNLKRGLLVVCLLRAH